MSDVFISYTRTDRDRIIPLAKALEARGYTVWWDMELVPGQKFEKLIKRELDTARCVVVVWTENSISEDGTYTSTWVEREADDGHLRDILLPVQLTANREHWRHNQTQAAIMHDWSGDTAAPGFCELLKGLERHSPERRPPVDQELARWQEAESIRTVALFSAFLAEFPDSRFAEIAKGRLSEIEEVGAWGELGNAPTNEQLAQFLRRYPSGRFADAAENQLRMRETGVSQRTTIRPSQDSLWSRLLLGAGASKIQTVWFYRHATAISIDPGASYRADIARPLTDAGRLQAQRLRDALKEQRVEFIAVGASPTIRALATAAIIADCGVDEVKRIGALIPPDSRQGSDADRINFLYDKIGDEPLRGYRILENDANVMDRYGAKQWGKLRHYLRSSPPGNILLLGHGVLTQAIIYSAIRGAGRRADDMRQMILDHELEQARGFRISLENFIPIDINIA